MAAQARSCWIPHMLKGKVRPSFTYSTKSYSPRSRNPNDPRLKMPSGLGISQLLPHATSKEA